ncbi:MAG TPA: hypothetical protein VJU83_00565 [Burkholderiales bacterium]|nr:hypothetical protein [Burkholderiales bacterium]
MAEPAVIDLKSCEAWLGRTPLADARQACSALTALLESLQESPPRDGAYLEILERLREPIVVALFERSKKFSSRPLPLIESEREAFHQVLDLWRSLGNAYRHLFMALTENSGAHPELRGQGALLAQRALDCVVDLMLSHYRCRRELDPELWQDLHALHRIVDQAGFAQQEVSVGRKSKSVSSAAEVYARALLLALANPYALSARELTWARRWSAKWAYKVQFSNDGKDCYTVNPQGNTPPAWAAKPPPNVFCVDAAEVRRSIRSRLKKLDAGETAESLGLGNDCVQPQCSDLLQTLARAWTEQPTTRQFHRRATPSAAKLSTSFEAIHVAITGRIFKDTAKQWSYARRHDTEDLYSYHGAAQAQSSAAVALDAENWEILDESATGFRVRRPAGQGQRLSQEQLVALRPDDGSSFILCDIRWLMTGIDESLSVGLSVLPGVAKGIAIRPLAAPDKPAEAYTQAFMLPRTPAGAATLIIPIGVFQGGRMIEARIDDELKRIQLCEHLQRGFDYDRASFVFAEN